MKPIVLAVSCAAAITLAASVQAQRLELRTNAAQIEPLQVINLNPALEHRLTPGGDFQLFCTDADAAGVCDGLQAPTNPLPAPVIASFSSSLISTSGEARAAEVNQDFNLTWTTQNAEICTPQPPDPVPGLTGWSAQVLPNVNTASGAVLRFTQLPTPQTVTLGLRCYGQGGRIDRTQSVDVIAGTTPPPPPPSNCARNGAGLLIQPAGWVNSGLRWEDVTGAGGFPPSGNSRAVGLNANAYISLPFQALPGLRLRGIFSPAGYAVNPPVGYEGLYWTISECPADFRSASSDPAVWADEPTLRPQCRGYIAGETDLILATTSVSGPECNIQEGRTYYLNMIQGGSSSAILLQQSTCPGGACGILFSFRG